MRSRASILLFHSPSSSIRRSNFFLDRGVCGRVEWNERAERAVAVVRPSCALLLVLVLLLLLLLLLLLHHCNNIYPLGARR